MTKVQVSDLSGPALDWAVKQCKGLEVGFEESSTWKPTYFRVNDEGIVHSVRELPGITVRRSAVSEEGSWQAIRGGYASAAHGDTREMAVLRCLVTDQWGFEIDVPDHVLATGRRDRKVTCS